MFARRCDTNRNHNSHYFGESLKQFGGMMKMFSRLANRAAVLASLLLVLLPCAIAQQTPDAPANHEFDMMWAVKIPMRDGVKLNATVYKPKDGGPQPAIFTLTPYIGDTYYPRANYFAQHGYVFLLVDVRGRGNSGGEYEPFANDAHDGYDIVEWVAKQPWCNGKVTMWGGSYAGFDQWSTLKEFPPHLATIVPAAAAHPGIDFPYFKNIFSLYDLQWLTYTSGVTPNTNLFGDGDFWHSK